MLDCSPPTNGGAGGGGVVGTSKPKAWLVSLSLRVEVMTIQRIITRSALRAEILQINSNLSNLYIFHNRNLFDL